MVLRLAAVGAAGALLWFLPYVLWALDVLQQYRGAVLVAMGLGAAVVLAGRWWTRGLVRRAAVTGT